MTLTCDALMGPCPSRVLIAVAFCRFHRGRAGANDEFLSCMGAFVYILRCADGSLYVGWTIDLERRIRQHQNSRASKYTRSRLPVELAAWFAVPDRTEARRLEARLKALPRARKLELLQETPLVSAVTGGLVG